MQLSQDLVSRKQVQDISPSLFDYNKSVNEQSSINGSEISKRISVFNSGRKSIHKNVGYKLTEGGIPKFKQVPAKLVSAGYVLVNGEPEGAEIYASKSPFSAL